MKAYITNRKAGSKKVKENTLTSTEIGAEARKLQNALRRLQDKCQHLKGAFDYNDPRIWRCKYCGNEERGPW